MNRNITFLTGLDAVERALLGLTQELDKIRRGHSDTARVQRARPKDQLASLLASKQEPEEIIKTMKKLNINPETLTGEQLARLMKPGVRVRRGRDWIHGDQVSVRTEKT